ncbi:MAG: hypothetical protein U9R15_05825, partial [Chloroflexota bacterium]|nr:hypothetical protein [Chloroflexota bacterium]
MKGLVSRKVATENIPADVIGWMNSNEPPKFVVGEVAYDNGDGWFVVPAVREKTEVIGCLGKFNADDEWCE